MRQIAGINSVITALENGTKVDVIYLDDKKDSKRINQVIELAKKRKIRIEKVDKLKLDLMVVGVKHQGVVANIDVLDSAKLSLEDVISKENPLILMLDGIQDPHNLGACLRSAAAAGVDAVIIPKDRAVGITPTVSKVASGGAEIVPIFLETNLGQTLEKLKKNNIWSIALTGYTESSIFDMDMRAGTVIIMGSEDNGVSEKLMQHSDYKAKIPMLGDIESLNVSVATGITLFEALRQRTK